MTALTALAATTLDALWAALPFVPLAVVVAMHLVAARVGDLRDREAPIGARVAPRRTQMQAAAVMMERRKRVALIAHDNRKQDLLDWARFNRTTLGGHDLFATGTTGSLLASELGLDVVRFKSGPLGGDQQVGAGIAEGRIDFVIFFWDPLEPHPHDVDVKALLRVAVVYNVPIACTRASADFMLSSPLMGAEYARLLPSFDERLWHPELAVAPLA